MNAPVYPAPARRRATPALRWPVRALRLAVAVVLLGWLGLGRPAGAYSLLTHEQLIDLTWQSSIVPLLLSRYPALTPPAMEQARAYAYGGCVIQDIGYYPLGDAFFSNLTHYVRSGDFVVNLFRNAQNANELAFAVGALSHYIGDTIGHAQATNRAVPIEFPKLAARFGSVVNYAQGEHEHVQTEFAFDINEIAQHRLAPSRYLRHVGLEVPRRQLALAFFQTYGIREDFSDRRSRRINVSAYRFAVRRFIPRIAYAVNLLHRSHEPVDPVGDPDLARLTREVSEVAQRNQWAVYRRKPGLGTYTLAGLLSVVPKLGPLKLVAVKGPVSSTEGDYIRSVLRSEDALGRALQRFTPPLPGAGATAAPSLPLPPPKAAPAEGQHELANRDLDTGNPVQPAGYRLADDTYAALLHDLTKTPATPIPPGIKRDVLAFYADLQLPFATKRDPSRWAALQHDLTTFRRMPTTTEPDPFPTYGVEVEDGPSGGASSRN